MPDLSVKPSSKDTIKKEDGQRRRTSRKRSVSASSRSSSSSGSSSGSSGTGSGSSSSGSSGSSSRDSSSSSSGSSRSSSSASSAHDSGARRRRSTSGGSGRKGGSGAMKPSDINSKVNQRQDKLPYNKRDVPPSSRDAVMARQERRRHTPDKVHPKASAALTPPRRKSTRTPTPPPPSPPPATKVRIDKLTRNVTKEHLKEIFSTWGQIKSVELIMDRIHPEFCKGSAYVEYDDAKSASAAVLHMNGGQIDGQEVILEIIQPPRPATTQARYRGGRSKDRTDNRRTSPFYSRRRTSPSRTQRPFERSADQRPAPRRRSSRSRSPAPGAGVRRENKRTNRSSSSSSR